MASPRVPYVPPTAEEARGWKCEEHGCNYAADGEESGRMVWECPECAAAAAKVEREWEVSWRRYLCWQHNSNIPGRFRTKTLKNWSREGDAGKRIGAAFDLYAENLGSHIESGSGVVLLGPPGLGKTHLLTAIVAEAISRGHRALYAVWPDVITEVKNGFNLPKGAERRDLIGMLKDVSLLALDELALKPSATDFETGLLFEVIDYRYREQMATLAASNATKATLGAIVGDRIADRLTQCSPTLVFAGQSKRASQPNGDSDGTQLTAPQETFVSRVHSMGKWKERTKERDFGGNYNRYK